MVDAMYGIGALLTSPLWGWRLWRTGKWRTDWRARRGFCDLPSQSVHVRKPTLLIHGVSVGEINAIEPMVRLLEKQTRDQWRIVISATTDTGIARARQLYGNRHDIVRFPLDFSRCVKRFLNTVKPDAVALVELEVWPNFMQQCASRGLPVCVINGRLSARSYKRYALIAPLVRSVFGKLTAAAVQTEEYAQRFQYLGVREHRLAVTDTMKWDAAELSQEVEGSQALARSMGLDMTRPIVVAGSTAPGEEKLLIETLPPEVQLVIAPRKPEWFDEVMKLTPDAVRRSQHPDSGPPRPIDDKRVFLLDTIGELRKAYALATICIVGRSFVKLYGSNVIEPVALGKPTVIGPYYSDFADIMAGFTEAGGVIVTARPGLAVKELLADPQAAATLARRGRNVILSRQGAAARHAQLIMGLMHNPVA